MRPALPLAIAAGGLVVPAAAAAATPPVTSGPLEVGVDEGSGRLSMAAGGRPLLSEMPGRSAGPTGRLGFRVDGRWRRATRLLEWTRGGRRAGHSALLATTDPRGRRLRARLRPDGRGAVRLVASVAGGSSDDVDALGIGFRARRGERYLGFGERSNAVDQRGRTIESYVGEGVYPPAVYPVVAPTIPPWGLRRRVDATYFPMPWLLSTRGYGVLVGNTEISRFRLGSDRRVAWSVEVEAPRLSLRLLAGPRPADVLRRLTARTGRQPRPAAPWLLGPWFQTGHANQVAGEMSYVRLLHGADAPVSAVETHMRYMPCGADIGLEDSERARTDAFHRAGLAALTYEREAVCAEYEAAFSAGVGRGAFLRRRDGSPYTFTAFVGGRVTDVALIDFTTARGDAFHATLLRRAVANGYDGWMEDYGEYVPPDAVGASGLGGERLHNLYPVLYHRSGDRFARRQARPIARFVRSGWTGVHPYAQIVWGGDPTTDWGFDGLRSSVVQALTMGLSGIGIWGSDVGGFFTLSDERLTRELLHRWIEFGAVSGVMRTKAEGIGVAASDRPQIWEPQSLPLWRRYAKLRTQLYPYIAGAVAAYRRSGLPLMRHLALAYPHDRRAIAREDEFLFGPHLLAAPVLEPGARSRRLYLPAGQWIDLWRSARYRERDGGLELRGALPLRGARFVRLRAPLDELPLLVRAGAVLPLLASDVDTLASYGAGGEQVRRRERRDEMQLLAFPRGRSSTRMGARGRLRSVAGRSGWTLAVRGRRIRRYRLQAALGGLRRPFRPRAVSVAGRRLPPRAWHYDRRTAVLRVSFRVRSGLLRVR